MAGAGQVWEDSIERAVRAKRVLLLKNVDPMVHSMDLEVSLPSQFALWKYLDWCQLIGMAKPDVHQLFVCDLEYCNVTGGSHLVTIQNAGITHSLFQDKM